MQLAERKYSRMQPCTMRSYFLLYCYETVNLRRILSLFRLNRFMNILLQESLKNFWRRWELGLSQLTGLGTVLVTSIVARHLSLPLMTLPKSQTFWSLGRRSGYLVILVVGLTAGQLLVTFRIALLVLQCGHLLGTTGGRCWCEPLLQCVTVLKKNQNMSLVRAI